MVDRGGCAISNPLCLDFQAPLEVRPTMTLVENFWFSIIMRGFLICPSMLTTTATFLTSTCLWAQRNFGVISHICPSFIDTTVPEPQKQCLRAAFLCD